MIPILIKERLAKDIFMQDCCVKDSECGGRIEWHHALIYAGRKVEVWWAILPLCTVHHLHADRKDVRAKLVVFMRERGGEEVAQYEKITPL